MRLTHATPPDRAVIRCSAIDEQTQLRADQTCPALFFSFTSVGWRVNPRTNIAGTATAMGGRAAA